MRTRLAALGIIAAVLAITACSYSSQGPLLTSSDLAGHTTSDARDVDEFTGIFVSGYASVTVTEGSEFDVVVTADENLQEHVTTRVKNDTLTIRQRYSYFGTPPAVNVEVTLPALSTVNLSGSSDVTIRVTNPDRLAINVSGSAQVQAYADAGALSLAVSGSGTITAHGAVTDATVSVSGSGQVDGTELTAVRADVSVSGSGDVLLGVRERLEAHVSGSGHVEYWGDPQIDQSVSGSGSVSKAPAARGS